MKHRDAEALLMGNLERVFNERDRDARDAALAELWSERAVMFEADEILDGHRAISNGVGAIHAKLPPGVRFRLVGQVVENHGTAMLRWQAAAPQAAPVVTGVDVASIVDGRIETLHVYLEGPSS